MWNPFKAKQSEDHVLLVDFYLTEDSTKLTTRVFGPMSQDKAKLYEDIMDGLFTGPSSTRAVRMRDMNEGLY